ncbi:ATP-dependent DNA ligase [Methanospirillum hungatei]|uniref:ATP-dependent DNA ligase n=1 Tax=Methanospirillum hungatei TaxID=2203 RepID=UPI0026F14E45|nr:ATP-dependent DNA ligase [Methanospirillum hungatei]MCA1917684.1 ATP-dependent DNA ligase [Methanospirillum hungatei]
MIFLEFAELCSRLEKISGRLETISILAETISSLSEDDLPHFCRLILGKPFPEWSGKKLGVGPNLLYEAVAYVTGRKREEVIDRLSRVGDAGAAVEELLSQKSQTSFFTVELTLADIMAALIEISGMEGGRSQKEKVRVIQRILSSASPLEGHYITAILLEDFRIGVGEGNLRDAIAQALSVDPGLVEYANQVRNDIGEVAVLARKGEEALRQVRLVPFHPVRMMLARQGTISGVLEEGDPVAVEYKYDGARFQFHKQNKTCRMYSRRLEEVTSAMPDVVALLDEALPDDIIVDGEVIAVQNGHPMPFQTVLRRFRRKHNIAEAADAITMIPNLFDILYYHQEMLIDLPFRERRNILTQVASKYVTPQLISDDETEIEAYYHTALDAGHEGVMLKVLGSRYTPGVRGKDWVKIKPEADTLDLVVTGAEWGEGKRAHVFGSFLLSVRDDDRLVPISRVATGFSDEQLSWLFDTLKDDVIRKEGKMVFFLSRLVFEIGYSEIQKSPNYEGGYALRFPRFIEVREDKDLKEANTAEDVEERYIQTHRSLNS